MTVQFTETTDTTCRYVRARNRLLRKAHFSRNVGAATRHNQVNGLHSAMFFFSVKWCQHFVDIVPGFQGRPGLQMPTYYNRKVKNQARERIWQRLDSQNSIATRQFVIPHFKTSSVIIEGLNQIYIFGLNILLRVVA